MEKMITQIRTLNFFSGFKKYIGGCCLLIMLLLMSGISQAQTPGEVCGDPINITGLPFSATDNTLAYGNNYVSGDRPDIAPGAVGSPSSSYLGGDDVVYAYTASSDGGLDISVTNHDAWTGVFVFTGCPFASTVGGATTSSATTDLIVNSLPVLSGETYYIVISTWPTPDNTSYTLNVSETTFDCPDILANIGDACDDGDANTINDEVGADCTCAGIIPPDGMVCEAPIQIASLPFLVTDNTSTYGDDYESGDRPPNAPGAVGNPSGSYLSGDDVVYAYTPSSNQAVDISVTNHGSYAGVFVFTGCPFASTVGGAANSLATVDLNVTALILDAGVTYYIVISTWASPQSTDYTLSITAADFDCPDLEANIGSPCDDGNSQTYDDTVNEDCVCAGTPYDCLELEANIGDACTMTGGMTGELDENCECVEVQCQNTSKYPSGVITPNATGASTQISSCNYWSEYSEIGGIVSGFEYEFNSVKDGVSAFVTVRSGSVGGAIVASGFGPLTITAPSSDNLFVHWNLDAICGTESGCATSTVSCISCATVEDCEGVVGGSALPGTSCDDGDPATINDLYDADCNCAGELPTEGSVCETVIPVDCNAEPATYSSAASNGTNTTTCSMGNKGLWFSFMGTGGEIIVNSSASFDHEMSINRGSCDDLTSVGCKDGSTLAETYTIANSVVGEMYYVYIAHYASGNNTTGDITISVVCAVPPTCPAPSSLAVDNITANSADVSWTAGADETEWEVLYGEAGFDVDLEGTSANVTSTTTTLDNLEANTSYGVYVRAVCGVDDNSEWVGPVSFTTTLEGGYCAVNFSSNVEPITYVNFAGINNTSDATINGSPALENFTTQTASVNLESSYPIEIQGNTDGSYTSRIVVYIDWNQDGIFDNSLGSDEMYELPNIVGSTGEDGIASEGFIEVPGTALLGNTRMRVMKRFSSIPAPCNTAGYGQAEDYSVNVSPGTPGPSNDNCENAIALSCGSSVEGTTIDATWSGQTDNCTFQDNPDVYYSLDVIAGTLYTVTVSGDDFDAVIAAYTGSCELLSKLICADDEFVDGGVESISWTAINTETVTIRTYDWSTSGGSFTISVSCGIGVDCPALNANIGDACDDDNPNTINDTVNSDCVCVGTSIEEPGCVNTILYPYNAVTPNADGSYTSINGCNYFGDYSIITGVIGGYDYAFTGQENTSGNLAYITVRSGTSDGPVVATGTSPLTITASDNSDLYIHWNADENCNGGSQCASTSVTCITCAPVLTTLNGTINWDSSCGDRAGTVRLYTPNTATLIETYNITVAADGTFSITDLPTGTYDVIVKVQGYLAKGIQDVVISAGVNTLAVGNIRNGNVNNDNSINLFDVSLINAAFNKTVGQAGYNPLADLNCDGSINIFDISILNVSFNKSGASAPL